MTHFLEYITLTNIIGVTGISLTFYVLYSNTKNSKETRIYIACFVLFILSILLMAWPNIQTYIESQTASWKTIYKTGDNIKIELTSNDFDITTGEELSTDASNVKPNTPVVIKVTDGENAETRAANITEINGRPTPDSKITKVEYGKEKSTVRITVAKTSSNELKSLFDD